MKNNEIMKKDWQILTARSHIYSLAFLRTILKNQGKILAHLENKTYAEVKEELNKQIKAERKVVENAIKKNELDFPNYGGI